MPHIAILVFRHSSFDDSCNYLLREVSDVWREQGYKVSVLNGPGERCDADIVVNHVDLTVVPADHVGVLRSFPKSINGNVIDISKRMISHLLVRPSHGYKGPVIAKSNLNAGGNMEAALALRGHMHPDYCRIFNTYHVFEDCSEVPEEIWNSRAVVVERFLPEREDEFYCLRTWVFLGDQESNSLSYAKTPIIKQRDVVRREVVPEVPDSLREMREELGFDYGKFDYAIVDGEVVLYDANRTPSLGTFSREDFLPRVRHYAAGIESLL